MQRDAQRHVHVQPQPQPARQPYVAPDAPQDHLAPAQHGHERLQDCGLGALFGARQAVGDEVDHRLLVRVGDEPCACIRSRLVRHHEARVVPRSQLPQNAAAEHGALDAALHGESDRRIAACGEVARLSIELIELRKELGAGAACAIVGDHAGAVQIDVQADEAAQNHGDHQRVREGMNVPAEVECAVQRRDDRERDAEVDVRRGPALHACRGARCRRACGFRTSASHTMSSAPAVPSV